MKLTNRLNLPGPIYEAVKNDGYTRGDADISVTTLVGPARKAALEAHHAADIVEDASDRIWSLLGQSIHTILERANRTGIAERRLGIMVEGWKVSGGMDLYEEDGVLVDYKTTSAFSLKKGVKEEWEAQLNVYAEILRQNGCRVTGLKIIGILRDWSVAEAARDPSYPQMQIAVLPVTLWPEDAALKYIRERVILHQQARIELPLCSHKERWAKDDTWAVKKAGAKRAINGGVYTREEDALNHAKQIPGAFVEARAGESTRCKFYCSVSRFCRQFQAVESSERSEWESDPLTLGQGKAG